MYFLISRYFCLVFPLLTLLIIMPVHAETLFQAWETALAKNYSLKAAQESVMANEEQLKATKAIRLPGLSFKSGYTIRDSEPQLMATLGPTTMALPVENQNNLAFQVAASIPLYTSGRITNGIKASTAILTASRADKESVLLNLKIQIAEAYVATLRAIHGLEVAKSYVASLEAHEHDVANLYKQGMVAQNDYLASQVTLADGRQQMLLLQNHIDLAQASLNRLLQQPLGKTTELEELTLENINEALPDLIEKAVTQRSELTALKKRNTALHNQAAGVRAEDLPQIAITGGYGYQQNDYLVEEGQWSIMLGLQWDLFDGGVSNHKANAISRQANALQQQYNDFVSIISLQTRQAWLNTQETQKRISVTKKAVAQAEENLKVSRNRYNSGLITNTEVLDAMTLRIKSQYNDTNAHYDRLLAILHLKRAIGDL